MTFDPDTASESSCRRYIAKCRGYTPGRLLTIGLGILYHLPPLWTWEALADEWSAYRIADIQRRGSRQEVSMRRTAVEGYDAAFLVARAWVEHKKGTDNAE